MTRKATNNAGAIQTIAQLGQVYVDILSGMRGPEQLSRWLSEDTYIEVAREHSLQHRARMAKKVANQRELFRVMRAEIFPSSKNTIEAVVLVKSNKTVQAITMRLDIIFDRWRVTHLELI